MNKELATEWLKKLISIPSYSKEEDRATDFLEQQIKSFGYTPVRYGNNLLVQPHAYVEKRPNILLNSHIDTVKASSSWTRDPFSPTEEKGRIYGLGSNDAGASLVSLLYVFLALDQISQAEKRSYNIWFLCAAEEEITGENGVEMVLPHLPSIDLAIVGEPTLMQPAVAERGLIVVDGYATGKSGHAARDEGENALYKAIKDIEQIQTFKFPKVSQLLGEVKCSVTQIEAGKQHNVVPDKCHFVIDIRCNELYKNETVIEMLQREVESRLEPRSLRLQSTKTPLSHPVVKSILQHTSHPYGSPTLSDQSVMPFSSIKWGVGDSARSHTPNEFIYREEIEKAIDIYIACLENI